jgi:hypothetical protein
MGRKGRREAETRFSWDAIAVRTTEVYSTALSDVSRDDPLGTNRRQETEDMIRRSTTNSKKSNGKTASRKTVDATRAAATSRQTVTPAFNRSPVPRKTVTEEQIRQRAYQIYIARRGAYGDPVSDWLQAERDLLRE